MKERIIQAVKIWIVIYPSITLFYLLFGNFLADMPIYLRTLILTLTLVPWMVFIALPMLNLLLLRITRNEKP
jgi:antibiotic biosynthesis monooxygenase (ABM) superfamily enzyme